MSPIHSKKYTVLLWTILAQSEWFVKQKFDKSVLELHMVKRDLCASCTITIIIIIIIIALYHTRNSTALRYDTCSTRVHTLTCHRTVAIPLQPQSIAAHWLVLIASTHEGMARLSWPVWLVTYWHKFSRGRSWTRVYGHPSHMYTDAYLYMKKLAQLHAVSQLNCS